MSEERRTDRIDPVKEAIAVRSLRESLAALDGDEELLLDTIEGETSLFECLDKLLARMADNRIMVEGIEAVVRDLGARQTRYENRIKADRTLIEQAMCVAELDKIERPTGTLSLARRPAKVEITTEADIPAEFWKPAAPTLDKKALTEALRSGRDVPGAVLTNSAPTLTIRIA